MESDHVVVLPNDLQSIGRVVDDLVAHCRDAGFDAERLRLNFRVGLTEALANAMLYGNCRDPRKRVRVETRCTSQAIRVRVTDEGAGFDPGVVPDPTLPPNRWRESGRGLFLIRRLMDKVEFNEQGNSITMVLFRRPPDGRNAAGP